MKQQIADVECVDVVGIGFGPANLALAIAFAEHEGGDGRRPSLRFFERQESFGWHRGMLIEEGTMQISFLKDLVTLRNPQSAFSFINYLKQCGRLSDFINLHTHFPSRLEFHDYLRWCAGFVDDQVRYGQEVVSIEPVREADGRVGRWLIGARSPKSDTRHYTYAKTVVLGRGISPAFPPGVVRSERVWHAAELLSRIDGIDPRPGDTFAVVGAGQSAAEIVSHLHRRFGDVYIHAIHSRHGYSPADDSPFVNGLFDPKAVDHFFALEPAARETLLSNHSNTNYGVVDIELIQEIYRNWYQERVAGRHRLHFHRHSQLCSVARVDDSLQLELRSLENGTTRSLAANFLVCATGYGAPGFASIFSAEAMALIDRSAGSCSVSRQYEIELHPDVSARLFTQEDREMTHGLTATLLSNLAVRSGEIAGEIVTGQQTRPAVALDDAIEQAASGLVTQ